jgi:signal transduction histidine kinase
VRGNFNLVMGPLAGPLRGRGLPLLAILLASLTVTVALAAAALSAHRSHRITAERVLRDYAGVAGTEFVRRTAFDVGFNGYQVVAAGLHRTAAAGSEGLPPGLSGEARGLVAHLFVVEGGEPRLVSGIDPPAGLDSWIRAEAAALPRDRDPFLARHRIEGGRAVTLVLVPLDESGARLAAFDVDPRGLRPYLQHSLARGPLLPGVIGDGHVTNAAIAISFRDHAGAEGLRAGAGAWPEWEVEVPFGDFYRGVLDGSHVRVSLDPAVAGRLLPGGLPPSQLPLLVLLVGCAGVLAALAAWQLLRERAFARMREDFVASVSHELRTPLAQVRLFTETVLLGRCRSEDEERRFLEAAARETLRLGQLVDNILDFSKAERGGLALTLTPRLLAPLVARITQAFQPLAATRGVRLQAELDPAAGAAVDEAGLTRLLLNLLDNAVKYGPEQAEVTVRLSRAGGAVELAVEDRGPGVPKGEREAIFAPFQRLDRDRRSRATGAGIGLAIVRELTTRHGGECRVEERPGGGARFVVSLPGAEAAR